MTTLEKVVAALENYDLDDASGFYTVELQKAARAVVEALKNAEVDDFAYRGPRWSRTDMDRWNDKLDAILNEK